MTTAGARPSRLETVVCAGARRRRLWIVLLAPWPAAVAVAAALDAAFGPGMAITMGFGLALALDISLTGMVIASALADRGVPRPRTPAGWRRPPRL